MYLHGTLKRCWHAATANLSVTPLWHSEGFASVYCCFIYFSNGIKWTDSKPKATLDCTMVLNTCSFQAVVVLALSQKILSCRAVVIAIAVRFFTSVVSSTASFNNEPKQVTRFFPGTFDPARKSIVEVCLLVIVLTHLA